MSRKEQLQRAHAFPERGRYVEHIAYEHNEQGAENLEADKERILAADTQLIHRAVKERLHDYAYHDDNAVPYAERDVFPVRAVPDADYKEYYQRGYAGGKYLCDMRAGSGLAKASTLHLLARVDEYIGHRDGIEQVIFKPCAERNMPSAPVFVDGS